MSSSPVHPGYEEEEGLYHHHHGPSSSQATQFPAGTTQQTTHTFHNNMTRVDSTFLPSFQSSPGNLVDPQPVEPGYCETDSQYRQPELPYTIASAPTTPFVLVPGVLLPGDWANVHTSSDSNANWPSSDHDYTQTGQVLHGDLAGVPWSSSDPAFQRPLPSDLSGAVLDAFNAGYSQGFQAGRLSAQQQSDSYAAGRCRLQFTHYDPDTGLFGRPREGGNIDGRAGSGAKRCFTCRNVPGDCQIEPGASANGTCSRWGSSYCRTFDIDPYGGTVEEV